MRDEITVKQKRFVEELVKIGNQTQAYKNVYKGCKSDTAARTNACKLLTKAHILAYRDELLQKMQSKNVASAEEVLIFLSEAMRGNIQDQFGLDPSLSDRLEAGKQLAKRFGLDKAVGDIDKKIDISISTGADDED